MVYKTKNFNSSGTATDGYDVFDHLTDGLSVIESTHPNSLADSIQETQKAIVDGYVFTDHLPNALTFDSTNKYLVYNNGTGKMEPGSAADVNGPASATDNAVARFDSTTGKLIQDSSATLGDDGYLVVNRLGVSGDGYIDGYLKVGNSSIVINGQDNIISTSGASDLTLSPGGNVVIPGNMLFEDQLSDPTAPSGDNVKLYAKDKKLYQIDSNNVPQQVGSGAGGAGELNYIGNPSGAVDEAGWSNSAGGQVTAVRTTTGSELPRPNLTATGLKIVATTGATGQFADYQFNVDEADFGKVIKIQWAQKPLGTYAAGELLVEVRNNSAITTITPAITEIPNYTGVFQTTFVTDSSSTDYELRFVSAGSATDGIVVSDVIVGPGSYAAIPDPRWPSYDESDVTFSSTPSGWASPKAYLVPYQDTEDNWRLAFNIQATTGSLTSRDFDLDGITVPSMYQACSHSGDASGGYCQMDTTGTFVTRSTAALTFVRVSGDIALASKPTWATKTAPDVYLAGKVNVDQVAFKAFGDGTAIADGAETNITFSDVSYDTHDGWDGVDEYTVPVSGIYDIYVYAYDAAVAQTTGNQYYIKLYVDGVASDTIARGESYTTSTGRLGIGGNTKLQLNAGEVVKARLFFDTSSGTFDVSDASYISITKLPSPQEVANAALTFSTATATRPGLIPSYQYEEIDISSSGNFSAAQPVLRIAKVGSVVTLTWGNLACSSSSGPSSAAGFIPTAYLPVETVRNSTNFGASLSIMAYVTTGGVLAFESRDWAGTGAATTGVNGSSLSWVVDE